MPLSSNSVCSGPRPGFFTSPAMMASYLSTGMPDDLALEGLGLDRLSCIFANECTGITVASLPPADDVLARRDRRPRRAATSAWAGSRPCPGTCAGVMQLRRRVVPRTWRRCVLRPPRCGSTCDGMSFALPSRHALLGLLPVHRGDEVLVVLRGVLLQQRVGLLGVVRREERPSRATGPCRSAPGRSRSPASGSGRRWPSGRWPCRP